MTELFIANIPERGQNSYFWPLLDPDTISRETSRISNQTYLNAHLTALSVLTYALRKATGYQNITLPVMSKNKHGKPYFENFPMKFNWSHSGRKLLLGVSNQEIGVDIEQSKDRNLAQVASRFFSADEVAYLQNNPKDEFFRLWVLREAVGKYIGTGLQAFQDLTIKPNERIIQYQKTEMNNAFVGKYEAYYLAVVAEDTVEKAKILTDDFSGEENETLTIERFC
ncbi:MAG: 4'-phosphopantetheinyl transferase superfamily protein [Succinivibrionaceae bacterium]|nr:4'-phosphopantetheinyl transferase superfamily protein [Succinivibrionaceae bacterium]